MTAIFLSLAFCVLCAPGQAKTKPDGKESVRVYVFAAEHPDQSNDEAQQRRLATVRELRDAIRRKAGLSVVDQRADADVVVEVLDRDEDSAGEGGFGGVKLTALVNTTIRLRVTAGERETDMKGTGAGSGSKAAKDATERLLKWIVRNRADR